MNNFEEKIDNFEVENIRLVKELGQANIFKNLMELLHSATSEPELLNTLIYSLKELDIFSRIVYLSIDKSSFSLIAKNWVGFSDNEIEDFSVPLSFMGGDLADAIFSNSQYFIENGIEDGDDLSIILNCNNYMVIPFGGRGKQGTVKEGKTFKSEDDMRRYLVSRHHFPIFGMFILEAPKVSEIFIDEGISIINQLIHGAGVIIENLRLLDQLELFHDRVEKELKQAEKVQLGLLPSHLPNNSEISVACQYIPKDTVSGDFYDLFEIDKGVYAVIVADVSGHGPSSALVMAMTKMLILTHARKDEVPSTTLEKVNKSLVTSVHTNKFITIFYALIDTNKGHIHYTSAGHCPVFLIDKGTRKLTELSSDGFFVGMFPELMLQDHDITYQAGGRRLVLYTDGVTEAQNEKAEQYGTENLSKSALRQLAFSPEKAVSMMLKDQEHFIGDNVLDDDITLMVLDF